MVPDHRDPGSDTRQEPASAQITKPTCIHKLLLTYQIRSIRLAEEASLRLSLPLTGMSPKQTPVRPHTSGEHVPNRTCTPIVQTLPMQHRATTTQLSGVRGHSDKHAPGHVPEAQCAFKILMIHEVLQFALRIAFRCVLHRCGSLDIRC